MINVIYLTLDWSCQNGALSLLSLKPGPFINNCCTKIKCFQYEFKESHLTVLCEFAKGLSPN